jgi:sulfate transport system permease protein
VTSFAIARAFDADGAAYFAPRRNASQRRAAVLPGFGLSLGITIVYLSLIVLIPLSAAFIKTSALSWPAFVDVVTAPRVMATYRLTFGASFIAAVINAVFGLLVAWVLVRYRFPGRRIADALVDLPFALPTAVAGIALTSACWSR